MGFCPEDHILGKPIFIWMSIEGINDGFKIGKLDGIGIYYNTWRWKA